MKTRSLKVLIILAVIATASLAGYYFAYAYVDGLSQETTQKLNDLNYSEAKYAQALSLSVVANSGQSEGKELDAYIIHSGDEIGVVKDLEHLAASLSLVSTTDSIDSQENTDLSQQNKDFLHIVMSTKGTLEQNRKFLALIETLPYNVKLNKIDLYDGGSGVTVGDRWQGRFDISIVKEMDAPPTQ